LLYVLHNPQDAASPEQVAKQIQYICAKDGTKSCLLILWKNAADVPAEFSIQDIRAAHPYIFYNRNNADKIEKAFLYHGDGQDSSEINLAAPHS
jgi:hypothetical protein